MAAIKTKSVN